MRLSMVLYTICMGALSTSPLFSGPQALNELVYALRSPQTDAAHFRKALEKIGETLAQGVLEQLETEEVTVETLTGSKASCLLVNETPALVTILRAGLPLNAGVQKVFPHSDVGFLAMSRNEETLEADVEYVALPDLKGRTVIISDTMLATGGSMLHAIHLIEKRAPKRIFIITAIAAQCGIERIFARYPEIKVFAATVDPLLNDKGYIIPGLGDAGDRAYGKKFHMD